ncbi:MAG: hypothetical protein AAGM22_13000, partial [Acidobacteriota bacterium]
LGVSPDGRFVYSIWEAEPDDFRLATLERTGDVLQTIFLDALNLAGTRPRLDVDPEGRFLYVYHGADELSRWLLDRGSGRPERLETLRQGADGIDWLGAGCFDCSSSLWAADGRLYLANTSSSTLATLAVGCETSDRAYCFQDERFAVRVDWETPDGQVGVGRTLDGATDESGLYWFFSPDNWELVVKILDGCTFNDRYWVFAAATTDVGFTLTVTDTVSGREAVYENPLGTSAEPIIDTQSLDLCIAGD